MRNGWIKHFSDGNSETGFDDDLRKHIGSWRNGRQEGLVSVDLHHRLGGKDLQLTLGLGIGEYWQSDTMQARYCGKGTSPIEFLVRRLEKKISAEDVGKYIEKEATDTLMRLRFVCADNGGICITEDLVDKWLTLELHIKTGQVTVTFEKNKQ